MSGANWGVVDSLRRNQIVAYVTANRYLCTISAADDLPGQIRNTLPIEQSVLTGTAGGCVRSAEIYFIQQLVRAELVFGIICTKK